MKCLNNKGVIHAILLDFKKASDKVTLWWINSIWDSWENSEVDIWLFN